MTHGACSIRDAIVFPSRLAFLCGGTKTIRIRYVWILFFLKTGIRVDDAQINESMLCVDSTDN